MKVLVFGSCNIDIVYSVQGIVRPGETAAAQTRATYPGGKGFNQAMALCKAGVPIHFAGCIGEDGRWLQSLLNEAGADTTLVRCTDTPTGCAVIQVDADGQNAIIVYPGANGKITPADALAVLAHFEAGDMLVLQNEISALDEIIDAAAEKGMRIMLNPSPFDAHFATLDLRKIAYLIVNETEGCALAQSDNPFDLIESVKSRGLATEVILTLGERGSVWWNGQTLTKGGVFKTEAVDTTAAGDTFTGYLVAGLLSGGTPAEILATAAAASAVAVSRHGASSSIPTPDEVASAKLALPYIEFGTK